MLERNTVVHAVELTCMATMSDLTAGIPIEVLAYIFNFTPTDDRHDR